MATVMLYPNKENPMGWRVQDKPLNENIYFPVSKLGSLDKAELEARKKAEKINGRRRMRSLRLELPLNQLFYKDGTVKGMRVGSREIKGVKTPILIAQIGVNGKQKKNTRILTNRPFTDAYYSLVEWILSEKKIEATPEIMRAFRKALPIYRNAH